jgi:hypothetical protein
MRVGAKKWAFKSNKEIGVEEKKHAVNSLPPLGWSETLPRLLRTSSRSKAVIAQASAAYTGSIRPNAAASRGRPSVAGAGESGKTLNDLGPTGAIIRDGDHICAPPAPQLA